MLVGVPVGTTEFVDAAISQVLLDCQQEFQKLIRFPFANCFILLLRYCCNQKLMYLMRKVSPEIMLPHAQKFDTMIEHFLAQYFNLDLTTAVNLSDIAPGSRLDSNQVKQLANFQIRDSEQRGGLGLSSMASLTIPVFFGSVFLPLTQHSSSSRACAILSDRQQQFWPLYESTPICSQATRESWRYNSG